MKRINLWPLVFVVAVLSGIGAMQHLDSQADDFSAMEAQERREWMQAIQYCHRTAGPQTAPEYTDDNKLVCIGRKGQRHNEVRLTKQ
jgi:hypothetical protein